VNKIAFAVGMIEGEMRKVHFDWCVKSLPWLILTDKERIIQAEAFGLGELDDRIETVK